MNCLPFFDPFQGRGFNEWFGERFDFRIVRSCLSASWENFVHGTRWEYLSPSRRKTMPLSL